MCLFHTIWAQQSCRIPSNLAPLIQPLHEDLQPDHEHEHAPHQQGHPNNDRQLILSAGQGRLQAVPQQEQQQPGWDHTSLSTREQVLVDFYHYGLWSGYLTVCFIHGNGCFLKQAHKIYLLFSRASWATPVSSSISCLLWQHRWLQHLATGQGTH